MSKSTGNFLTLDEAVNRFSADGMRLALADAGDAIEDANFVYDVADAGALRLYNFIDHAKETVQKKEKGLYRSGARTLVDSYFANRMAELVGLAQEAYERTEYKNALKFGLFEFQAARDLYREMCGGEEQMHQQLVDRFTEVQCLILSPICPHITEHVWRLTGHTTLLTDERWPQVEALDDDLTRQLDFISEAVKAFRAKLQVGVGGRRG